MQGIARVRVLAAQVDVAVRGAHREAGDGHALDQHERVALHQHAVGVGARVALVGVADDVLLPGRGVQAGLPLDAGGERRAAAAAQAGVGHGLHDLRRLQLQRVLQAAVAAVGAVVGQAARIDDADAGEGEPLLFRQIRNLRGEAVAQRVRAAVQEIRVEQARHVGRLHRAVGHAALRRDHLDQRLQPVQAARAVAQQLHVQPAPLRLGRQRGGGGLGAERQRARVARNVDSDAHATSCAVFSQASKLAGVTRPCSSSSTSSAGEQAQLPRQ